MNAFVIFRRRCTCSVPIGLLQERIENGESVPGCDKMCCKLNILHAPFYFVVNVDDERLVVKKDTGMARREESTPDYEIKAPKIGSIKL
ncbi:MAG: hypothetical protein KatS3mg101_0824 [Patescibacteria group bacterium]|nr:MAG: hypothetical protein KatS3mg101_0824 [Patescibacteria group bacterium]